MIIYVLKAGYAGDGADDAERWNVCAFRDAEHAAAHVAELHEEWARVLSHFARIEREALGPEADGDLVEQIEASPGAAWPQVSWDRFVHFHRGRAALYGATPGARARGKYSERLTADSLETKLQRLDPVSARRHWAGDAPAYGIERLDLREVSE